jgi:hypothetical protein
LGPSFRQLTLNFSTTFSRRPIPPIQPPISSLHPRIPAMADHADDLHPEQTEGFKVGEKKTIDEYQKLGT